MNGNFEDLRGQVLPEAAWGDSLCFFRAEAGSNLSRWIISTFSYHIPGSPTGSGRSCPCCFSLAGTFSCWVGFWVFSLQSPCISRMQCQAFSTMSVQATSLQNILCWRLMHVDTVSSSTWGKAISKAFGDQQIRSVISTIFEKPH